MGEHAKPSGEEQPLPHWGPWTPKQDEEWPERVYRTMTDVARGMLEWGAGSAAAKALDEHDRPIEIHAVTLIGDELVLATWVECRTGNLLHATASVADLGREQADL